MSLFDAQEANTHFDILKIQGIIGMRFRCFIVANQLYSFVEQDVDFVQRNSYNRAMSLVLLYDPIYLIALY